MEYIKEALEIVKAQASHRPMTVEEMTAMIQSLSKNLQSITDGCCAEGGTTAPTAADAKKANGKMIGFVKKWLSINREKFKFPPVIVEEDSALLRLNFEGILPYLCVSISVDKSGCSIDVLAIVPEFENGCDLLTDFDLAILSKDGKYYCRLCSDEGEVNFYDTQEELWEKHSLVPMLEWCNDNFSTDCFLYCIQVRGCFAAQIEIVKGLPRHKGDCDREAYYKVVVT